MTQVAPMGSRTQHWNMYLMPTRTVEADFGLNPRLELFSRRGWTTVSAQQSNLYGMMPYMGCIIFFLGGAGGWHKHNSLRLAPIQPSSPSYKELHAMAHFCFSSLTNNLQNKNCRLRWDSNSAFRIWRWTCWPLDQNGSRPNLILPLHFPATD